MWVLPGSTAAGQRERRNLLIVPPAMAAALLAGLVACESPAGPTIAIPPPPSLPGVCESRVDTFSGGGVTLTLVVQGSATADSAPARWPRLIARLFAQERCTVSGQYASDGRVGQVEGALTVSSTTTASFEGTLLEADAATGCVAEKAYTGTLDGGSLAWSPGATVQACPSDPFTALGSLNLSRSDAPSPPPPTPLFRRLTVDLSGTGEGLVRSRPERIDCGQGSSDECSRSFGRGDVVELVATPASGSTFDGWSGDTDCRDGRVRLGTDRRCTATFTLDGAAPGPGPGPAPDPTPPDTRTLTVTRLGTGRGTVRSSPPGITCGATCVATFDQGTVVTLTATPATGSRFDGWGGAADCADGVVTLDTSRTCRATFTLDAPTTPPPAPTRHTLTLTFAGTGTGSVTSSPAGLSCARSCAADFDEGTAVQLTAMAGAGSTFAGWGGDCNEGGAVTVNGPRTCTATFAPVPVATYRLEVLFGGVVGGVITSDPPGINCGSQCVNDFDEGSAVELTATALRGFIFTGWDPACGGNDAVTTVVMDSDHTCVAGFDALPSQQLRVRVMPADAGTLEVRAPGEPGLDCRNDCVQSFPFGTEVTVTAQDDRDTVLFAWGEDCFAQGAPRTRTLTMTEPRECIANFVSAP